MNLINLRSLKALVLILVWSSGGSPAPAADLLRVQPVTDKILMLHFTEGHIDYNGVRPDGTFEPQTENRVYAGAPLEPEAVSDKSRYHITSADDPTRHDAIAKESRILTNAATGAFKFGAPANRAVLFHFKRND